MKLSDIHKEDIFKVPERYFDHLPETIQNRIIKSKSTQTNFYMGFVKYVVPVMILIFAALLWLVKPQQSQTPEAILSQVSTEDLIEYLMVNEVSEELILQSIDPASVSFEVDEQDLERDLELDDEIIRELYQRYDTTYL